MPSDRETDVQTGKRKRRRRRRNRSESAHFQKSLLRVPVQVLDRLLELIPADTKLPITEIDLVLLYHVVGRKADRSAEARHLIEETLERFELEESSEHDNPRKPSFVLAVLLSRNPTFQGLAITAEELALLERTVGKTPLALDTTDEVFAAPLTAAELVTLEFGEVTTKEAATLAGVSHRSIIRDVQEGKLRGRRHGGRYRFIEARSLRTYLERQSRPPEDEGL